MSDNGDGYRNNGDGDHGITYSVELLPLSEVVFEPVRWLWPGRFALGKISMIVGDPGLGKSTVSLDIASRVSRGTPWPDSPDEPQTPGSVLLLSGEDELEDTVGPRVEAAGGAYEKIIVITGVKAVDNETKRKSYLLMDLVAHLDRIEEAFKILPDVRALIIDPVMSYCGRTDTHKQSDVRAMLTPLAALTAKYRVATIMVQHLSKKSEGPAIHRAGGSIGFVAACRSSWAVVQDKNDEQRRLFLPMKNNLAHTPGMAFRLVTSELSTMDPPLAAVSWEAGEVVEKLDDAMDSKRGQDRSMRDEAKRWLVEALQAGPVAAKELFRLGKEEAIGQSTLKRAKLESAITSRRVGFGRGSYVLWYLPEHEDAAEAQSIEAGEGIQE